MGVSKNKALKCIQDLRLEITTLKNVKEDSAEYRSWKHRVDSIIKQIFEETSSEYKSIHEILNPLCMGPSGMYVDYHELYLNRLDTLDAKFQGFKAAIELWEDDENPKDNDAISILNSILPRFHKFARQFRHRYAGRTGIEIKDEYDVQDMLHAILKLHFEDIRKEEYTPSYAGSSTRVDFLLKNENIVIEVKNTRDDLKDKELGKQLILDKEHYSVHPDCDTLVCFIYDPDELLSNPNGLINDLSKPNLGLNTIVIISPNN